MNHTPMDLEEQLRQLAPAFKDGTEPPASLHAGIIDRIEERSSRYQGARRQLWPSIAGVAIVLVAATAVGAAVVIRGLRPTNVVTHHPTPTPVASPSATPAPTPMSQQLQVPESTPVILFHDPANFDQIDGITWDGSAKGRIAVNPVKDRGIIQNPTGTLWTNFQDIRDRAGTVVASLPVEGKRFGGTWADDGRHYCRMDSKDSFGVVGGVPSTLQIAAVGQGPRNVVQVGRVYEQTSVGVAACSIENDRAVVVQANSAGGAVQFWVVQLSTGRILWTRPSTNITVSRDGRYIAEASRDARTQTWTTTIYGSTGTVLGHVGGSIMAFSWDGLLVVETTENTGGVSVVRWRDGKVVWMGPADGAFYEAKPEPGGQRIMVSVLNPEHPQTGGYAPVDVYIVSPDGQATELLANVMR